MPAFNFFIVSSDSDYIIYISTISSIMNSIIFMFIFHHRKENLGALARQCLLEINVPAVRPASSSTAIDSLYIAILDQKVWLRCVRACVYLCVFVCACVCVCVCARVDVGV